MTAPALSSLSPPVEVQPPEFRPYRYGLLSAAQRIEEGGRWELGGVTYTTTGCPITTDEWVTRCPIDPPPPGPPPEKNIPIGLEEVTGKPFMLYDAVSCYPMGGRTEEELGAFAVESLTAGEQVKLEQKFWAFIRANAAVVIDPPGADTSWSMDLGLGVLESQLAEYYGGLGVIHVPRYALPYATTLRLTHAVGDQLLDPADNVWAFGAGYDATGPGVHDPAPAGQAWMYATGPVVLRRAPITQQSAFDRRTNERRALAERSYVLTVECPTFAVLVQISER